MSMDELTEKASLPSKTIPSQDAAIAILSANHDVLSWNHGIETLTGYTVEALSHLNLVGIFEPADIMRQVLLRVNAGESPASVRLQLRTADGRRLPVDVQCAPLQSFDHSKTQMILVIREVAPLHGWRHRDTTLPLLGQLAGVLSHEIRNPMNAIFLHADILEEEVQQPARGDCTQATQSLQTIKAELTRLHGLIQDYLFLARLSNLPREPIDLGALVEDIVYEMHPQCVVHGVTMVLNGLDNLGEVELHRSSFRRALLHILQWLIEAMPRDATLTLSGCRTSHHVQLHIHDLKNVIPPEVWAAFPVSPQPKLPEAADLRKYVTQEILTAHGGEIAVSDVTKSGMLFTIALPLGTAG
jgi:PAS domain S-box-containing protein